MNSFLDAKGAFKRIRKLTIKWPGTYGTSKATTKLGANVFVPRGAGWHGMMDEVAIFSKALTKDELRTISKNGLGETVLPVEPAGKLRCDLGSVENRKIVIDNFNPDFTFLRWRAKLVLLWCFSKQVQNSKF